MRIFKIVAILICIVFIESCKNCKEPYSPYIASFKLKDEKVDSIEKVVIYFYSNKSNFNQAIDSLSVNKRQYNNDIDFDFMRKSDTLRSFMYKITFANNSVKEFKIRLKSDFCYNCGDCDEQVYPQTIEINGVIKKNKGNVIDLN